MLDAGAGAIFYLKDCGFKNLNGVDPNIESNIVDGNCVTCWKKNLDEIEGTFDIISFQNVLEHVENP